MFRSRWFRATWLVSPGVGPDPVSHRRGRRRHAGNRAGRKRRVIHRPVGAFAAVKVVVARAANQDVIAVAALEDVVALAAGEHVVAVVAEEDVLAQAAQDPVRSRPAAQLVVAVATHEVIRAGAPTQVVVAGVTAQLEPRRDDRRAIDLVVAGAAFHQRGHGQALQPYLVVAPAGVHVDGA